MASSYYLKIGGVTIEIETDDAIRLDNIDPINQPFFYSRDIPSEIADITISITLDSIPQTDHLVKIFDSDQSWSMFRDNDAYYVAMHPPALENPLWLVKTNHTFTRGVIYCSESLVTEKNGKFQVSNPIAYPLDQILLMNHLARGKGALIHAAGVLFHGRGIIFPGRSGAGKSSISKQMTLGTGFELLSDDRIIVREMNHLFRIYGTPWPGEAGISVNRSAPLEGILFLCHGSENRITPIGPAESLERLIPTVSVPWYDGGLMSGCLDFCGALASRVPAGELHFTQDMKVLPVLEIFMGT